MCYRSSPSGDTALHIAAREGCPLNIIKELVAVIKKPGTEGRASVQTKNDYLRTAVHELALRTLETSKEQYIELFEYFKKQEVPLNLKDNIGRTALDWSIATNNVNAREALMDLKKNKGIAIDNEETPSALATREEKGKFTKLLAQDHKFSASSAHNLRHYFLEHTSQQRSNAR